VKGHRDHMSPKFSHFWVQHNITHQVTQISDHFCAVPVSNTWQRSCSARSLRK